MGDLWYYTRDGEQQGPVDTTELQRLATAGQLQPADLVWRQGMPLWMPASDTRGLFPDQRLDHLPAPTAPPPQVIPVEPSEPGAAPVPGSSPARPPRRPAGRRGMSTGAKVALFGTIGAAVLIVLIVILAVSLSRRSPRGPHDQGSYVVNLNQGGRDVHRLRFAAGSQVTISVRSDLNTDVDLYVFDEFNNLVVSDVLPDRDCFVSFRAPRAALFRVEVVNLGPGPNRSVVRYH